MFRHVGMALALGSIFALGSAMPAAWAHGTTERVSVSSGGAQSNGDSYDLPAISANGRFVAFTSQASNLVPGDTNSHADIFVRDRQTGTTRRVSVSSGGGQGNSGSAKPAISAGGRFVAFDSFASNLVPGDTNDTLDTFIRDRQTGTTERVSVSSAGAQADGSSAALSANGRFAVFFSSDRNLAPGDTNDVLDVFVRDRQMGTTRRVSVSSTGAEGNGDSDNPAISPGGRFVAFGSWATNLVPDDTNDMTDVFVRDRQMGTTRRVSVSSGSNQSSGHSSAPAISANGRFVAFMSIATNLVPGDTNETGDVFVRSLAP